MGEGGRYGIGGGGGTIEARSRCIEGGLLRAEDACLELDLSVEAVSCCNCLAAEAFRSLLGGSGELPELERLSLSSSSSSASRSAARAASRSNRCRFSSSFHSWNLSTRVCTSAMK